jgi:hypothetical protein
MTQDDPKVLEAAYSAVKMQRMRADIYDLWGSDPENRENLVNIEEILKNALVNAKRKKEEKLRGGVKPRAFEHENV